MTEPSKQITVPRSALAAFLEDRLGEDEVRARGLVRGTHRAWRELDAKRAILGEYVNRDEDVALMMGPDSPRQREWAGLHLAARLIAAVYSDHPAYRKEWTP